MSSTKHTPERRALSVAETARTCGISREPRASAPLKRRGYRLNEFVAMSGMSRATVYRKIKSGTIKVVHLDGMPIITAETVRELLGDE
jgi:predicted DNA-binding transcriptional regulator AlpA